MPCWFPYYHFLSLLYTLVRLNILTKSLSSCSPLAQEATVTLCHLSLEAWIPLLCLCAVLCLVAQSRLTLCDPMDCSPPGSSVHGIFQARIQEQVAISFSRRSSRPRNQTHISCIAGGFLTTGSPGFSLGASGKESACQCNPWKPIEGDGPHQSR